MQGAFSGLPATASMGRMVSGYLEALEGAAMLESYPDAETTAVMQLSKGMAKVRSSPACSGYPKHGMVGQAGMGRAWLDELLVCKTVGCVPLACLACFGCREQAGGTTAAIATGECIA